MNLKESFRYQTFLDRMLNAAAASVTNPSHCLLITKTHMKKETNPDAANEEEVTTTDDFVENDTMISFMLHLVEEKSRLSKAIGKAKAGLSFDMDEAISTNKYRQQLSGAIRSMIRFRPYVQKCKETAYKFNAEGVQVPYMYEARIEAKENYDKAQAKTIMRGVISEADKVSAEIDAAMINTQVDYIPLYDVNESFDDVVEVFIQTKKSEHE